MQDTNSLPFLEFNLNQIRDQEPAWGPMGKDVYERTYQRVKSNGTRETWDETVRRVVHGNLSLVSRERTFPGEEEELYDLIYNFRAIPGGRHLWMSGIEGRQFLFNCYVSGWGDRLSEHFTFTFNQLMEGGGVGANYSAKHVGKYSVSNLTRLHLICDPSHPDYEELVKANVLSHEFDMRAASDAFLVEDSREGWTRTLGWVIDIAENPSYYPEEESMNLVIDLSAIRAAGLPIKTFGGTSAGPVPFAKLLKEVGHLLNIAWETGMNGSIAMEIDHAIATCVVSGNVRRSARMSIMHWDDPEIEWFLSCKESGLSHWSTNISVEIDNEFIEYINGDPGLSSNDPRRERARWVYSRITEGMLTNGEPGIWNSDLANVGEPNTVISTNPCGEISLEGWENCNLGHVNLGSFVDASGSVDYDGLYRAHYLMARFLVRATYGDITDSKTRNVVDRNRRIGVGHFGFAGFLAKQGFKWSESWHNRYVINTLERSKDVVWNAVVGYANELRIPVPVKTTTLAPTGTVAKLAGATESMNPIFAKYMIQRVRYSSIDPWQREQIARHRQEGYNVVPDPQVPNTMVVETPVKNILVDELEKNGWGTDHLEDQSEISLEDHLRVQAMYQKHYVDNSISYTISVNPNQITPEELAETLRPHLGSIKGTTVFPERGYELAPMSRVHPDDFARLRGSQRATDGIDEACATGACPVR